MILVIIGVIKLSPVSQFAGRFFTIWATREASPLPPKIDETKQKENSFIFKDYPQFIKAIKRLTIRHSKIIHNENKTNPRATVGQPTTDTCYHNSHTSNDDAILFDSLSLEPPKFTLELQNLPWIFSCPSFFKFIFISCPSF